MTKYIDPLSNIIDTYQEAWLITISQYPIGVLVCIQLISHYFILYICF